MTFDSIYAIITLLWKNTKIKTIKIKTKNILKLAEKALRRLGTTALTFGAVSGALGGWFGHDMYKKPPENRSQKKFSKMSSVKS